MRRPAAALFGGTLLLALVAFGRVAEAAPRPPLAPSDDPRLLTDFPVIPITRSEPGPLGPITILGDSVLVGASYEPSLPTRLAEQGWGPIRFQARGGYSSGRHRPYNDQWALSTWIRTWRTQGWDPPNVVINLGANDVGFCDHTVACNLATIRYLMDVIGPNPSVFWPMVTTADPRDQAAWNTALLQAAAERPNLVVWDWPTARLQEGIPISWDNTHLAGTDAYRRRSLLMATEITARLGPTTHQGNDAPVPGPAGPPLDYQALTPSRVTDTRTAGTPAPVAAGESLVVDLGSAVPVGSTAVAVNVTADAPDGEGYLTAYACDAAVPEASTVNFEAGATRAAHTVAPLSAARTLCIYASVRTHVLVDLQGAMTTAPAGRLTPLEPDRVLDTRYAGRDTVVGFDAPVGATAVALNLTATGARADGYLTAYPCGIDPPNVSNVNYRAGESIAVSAFVPVGADGRVCVFAPVPTDVIVDLTGVFRPGLGLHFVPAAPTRMLDTRTGVGGWVGRFAAGQTIDVLVAPAGAAAVTGTLTMVRPSPGGYLTAYPAGSAVPATSSVNAADGAVRANSTTLGIAGGRLDVLSSARSHALFDVTGWWVP